MLVPLPLRGRPVAERTSSYSAALELARDPGAVTVAPNDAADHTMDADRESQDWSSAAPLAGAVEFPAMPWDLTSSGTSCTFTCGCGAQASSHAAHAGRRATA
jgi:hypothetical protein